MVARHPPLSSLLRLCYEAAFRFNPIWMWIPELLFCNALWLWIEDVCLPSPLWRWIEGVWASNSLLTTVIRCPERQSIVEVPSLDYTGNMGRPHEMGFSGLPDDVVAAILANLPLHQLARVSRTCRAFQVVCRRQVAQERNTRCDLAVGCVGRERLIYLALIIDRFTKGEPVGPELAEKGKGAEWVLVLEKIYRKKSDRTYNAGDMVVRVWLDPLGNSLLIWVPILKGAVLQFCIRLYISPDELTINVTNIGEENALNVMEGTAILQTLLSGGLAPRVSEPEVQSGVCTKRHLILSPGGPWVPMPSRHTFAAVGLGDSRFRHEHIQVYQVGYYSDFGQSPSSTRRLHLRVAVCSTPVTRCLTYRFIQYLAYFFS